MSEKKPDNEVTREAARALEEDFFTRLKARFQAVEAVFNPLDGRSYAPEPSVAPMQKDEKDRVKRLMVESGVLDRNVRKQMPVNRALRFDLGSRSLFSGFTPAVCLVGLVQNPLEELAARGVSSAPLAYTALDEAVRRATDRVKVFHWVGVLSPTGFSRDCLASPPREKHFGTVLVKRKADGSWSVNGADSLPWPGAADLFDLETVPEEIERCKRTILDHPDLRLKGGHLRLDEIRIEMGFKPELADKAIEGLLKRSSEFQVREYDGERILQRSRF